MKSSSLLNVETHQIEFSYEVGKEASCYVWLTNNTTKKVAFKVKSSDPRKYFGTPAVGLILPLQACVVVVRMIAPKVNSQIQCQDKFVIQSLVARPTATSDDITSNMFREAEPYVEEHELGVVYSVSSEPYQTDDYLDSYTSEVYLIDQFREAESYVEEHELGVVYSVSSEPYQTEDNFNSFTSEDILGVIGSWLVYGFLALIFLSLIQKTMSYIWTLAIVLLLKVVIKIVSDKLEDWTVNALVQVIVHFARSLFDHVKSRYISSSI